MRLLWGWLLLISTLPSVAQSDTALLTKNPSFEKALLKQIRLPAQVIRQRKSVRIYVGFIVTKQGDCQQASILNSKPVDQSLHEAINGVWAHLPNVSPHFQGRYVLPIAFVYGQSGTDEEQPISNPDDTIQTQDSFTLLREIRMNSWIVCELRRDTALKPLLPKSPFVRN